MLGDVSPRRRFRSQVTVLAVASALLVLPALAGTTPALAATDPCGSLGNAISCENSKPGTPQSVWDVQGSGDASIQGFATAISVNVGQTESFKIKTDARAYTITIYRMGYYGGDGARQVATVTPSASLPQTQPACITDQTTYLYDCGNWGVSASWNVPSTAVSGVYMARLYRADKDDASQIMFIVRNDASHSDIVYQTSDPTWQAYNTYGGSDFYTGGGSNGRAYQVSYNRPVLTRDSPGGQDYFFSNEFPLVEFLEQNGYDVSYISGVDTDRSGSLLLNHKIFLSVGHDEYWSAAQRANVLAARNAGVNLQFLSGNEMYWHTRYTASADASHTPYRTLVSYKETWSNAKVDPSAEWTGTYRDPRFAPKSQGAGIPENALTGTIFMSNYTDLPLTVTSAQGRTRLWRNTSLASLAAGSAAQLAPHTVGYESDEDQDNGSRPPGEIDLSTTTGAVTQELLDYGSTTGNATTTHHLTLYRAASGALVFGAGTVQWTWGLNANHDTPYAPAAADSRMQQAEVNLLADMSAQPTTLMSGLVAAAKSTDSTGPTVTILSPAAGSNQPNGTQVTVSGTATDSGGGVVAGVEYSTDGGTSWHPATGTTSWSFTYVQHDTGTVPVQVRAVDDSANIGAAASWSFAVACPCSIFGSAPPPTVLTSQAGPASTTTSDASAVELGLRFTPTSNGFVTGVRFYKGAGNTGTHVGSLWSTAGQKLASATFSNESGSGWQSVSFSTPVAVSAGTTYVVSYTDPNGHYASQSNAFSSAGVDAAPLAVDGGFGATPAGVYGTVGTFPNASFQNSNYFVDVTFTATDSSPLIATNQTPLDGSTSVSPTTTVSAKYSKPLAAGTQGVTLKDPNGTAVAGTTAYDSATRIVTFTPSSPLSGFVKYTATLSGTDTQGNPVTTGKSWSFTTAKPPGTPGVCPCTLFDDGTTPTVLDSGETTPVTVGVTFSSSLDGTITGIRFYKGPNNTGTHVGTLWTASGTALATGTFTGESTSGWQTLTFAQPVSITKNTVYVASYRSTTGSYSLTPNGFAANNLSRTPLQVTSSAGAYTYSTGFPSSSSASNYFVDPVFMKPTATISMTATSPASGAVDVPRGASITAWFSAPISSTGYSVTVKQGTTALAGTTVLSADASSLSFNPSSSLPADSDITVTVSGVTSTDGASLPTQAWTFHTATAGATPTQSLFSNQVPTEVSSTDTSAVELGMAFTTARNGVVSGVRFYKGAGNGGTHTGSLWSATGTRLATVTFSGETPTGWQTASFGSPVAVTAGTTYVVSYLAPQGHYSDTPNFFSSPLTNGDLTAPAGGNGRYLYGSGGGFPAFTYNATNYFVDVVFAPTISVTDKSPNNGATDVVRTVHPSITFSSPISSGWSMTGSQGATTIAGSAALSTDGQTLTFTPTATLPADSDITVTVNGVVSTGGATLPTTSWTFHTEASATTTVSMFSGLTPASTSIDDSGAVELGTAFTPSVDGTVMAIQFFKGAGNTGTHTGSIWSASGTRLATVTFAGETDSGWQTATLATPLPLTAGQTYVVSYFAPNGHYSATGGFFGSDWTAGPLTAPATNNGRYLYAAGGGFPNSTYGASNYFVDVVFRYATS
jgi:hypothetical protein